ncbi:hypothetical protein PHLCEN_2v6351 [Hermanssonia centrifuga]|uniref:Uncharacterized protein n=1 Tax=Hermanssonia centrifuga TaxID=98765 RepID=A0A2R6NZQ6_9APHY|nr:hypothetical protein PHLCEN_2v6351 [Hermanssonia centrifuga]
MDWSKAFQHSFGLQQALPTVPNQSALPNFDESNDGLSPWLSHHTRILVLGTLIPGCIALLTLSYDLLACIRWPVCMRKLAKRVKSPFRDFLTLDDLQESEPRPVLVPPTWKIRTLIVLSALEAICWAAFFAYCQFLDNAGTAYVIQTGVGLLTWVRSLVPYRSSLV